MCCGTPPLRQPSAPLPNLSSVAGTSTGSQCRVAYVRFGLLGEDGEKTFLQGLESQTKVGRRVEVREMGEGE